METADNIESLIRKAQELLDNKKTQAAIDTIHKVLEFNPSSIEGIKVYGQCLVKLNQITETSSSLAASPMLIVTDRMSSISF
ncbi:hypothetical protein FLX35_05680 [Cylindrospermopsis raciborskii LB2897]|uniref:tetratricopeptide repeat protein n=1 Tax=Cylindrospermopsis raciborskii TaxID=77022 RepID=UPI001454BBE2|nr:hypothetical protein [Cylindrospermopsis raciborskii]MBG0743834.1 hypothetical protein [Cylindrospermopsis raciborskii KL1]NLQ07328.1 hypothetical protein [Cylindrospermopsis raciborskii LB2897]